MTQQQLQSSRQPPAASMPAPRFGVTALPRLAKPFVKCNPSPCGSYAANALKWCPRKVFEKHTLRRFAEALSQKMCSWKFAEGKGPLQMKLAEVLAEVSIRPLRFKENKTQSSDVETGWLNTRVLVQALKAELCVFHCPKRGAWQIRIWASRSAAGACRQPFSPFHFPQNHFRQTNLAGIQRSSDAGGFSLPWPSLKVANILNKTPRFHLTADAMLIE